MSEESTGQPIPPYVSFQTVLNQIERMELEGVPARIDGHYLVGMSGGTQNQFKHALRSLGLIRDDDKVEESLTELAENPDRRPELFAEILSNRYPKLVELPQNATAGQLDEALAEFGLGKDTRRKAATFYVSAANYAGLPVSKLFKSGRAASGTAARRSSSASRRTGTTRRGTTKSGTAADPTPVSEGHSHTVKLRTGGTMTLTVDVNPLSLKGVERTFFYAVVDLLDEYEAGTDSPLPSAAGEGSAGTKEAPS